MDRRSFGAAVASAVVVAPAANAQVFLDPAMYGDQELRIGAVDSVKESVRRAILQKPKLAPAFYQLALLDGLSYDATTNSYGPDGSILKRVLSSKDESVANLQEACLVLVNAEKNLRKKVAITIADAIAIGGSEAIESIGGPVLSVQLGRTDAPLKQAVNEDVPLDLFSGNIDFEKVSSVFTKAGLSDREMTALLGGLLTLDYVEKTRSVDDWKMAARPKFREAGKMGRMSEFKPITEEDILQAELEDDPEYEDPDDGWYIADSFGTRDSRFGDRIGKEEIGEKTFNKYLQTMDQINKDKKKDNSELQQFGWIAVGLMDAKKSPTTAIWVAKYGSSNLTYLKDLNVAYNGVTQLGGVYTGGKYESLLKNKKRKSLNDDDLKLF